MPSTKRVHNIDRMAHTAVPIDSAVYIDHNPKLSLCAEGRESYYGPCVNNLLF